MLGYEQKGYDLLHTTSPHALPRSIRPPRSVDHQAHGVSIDRVYSAMDAAATTFGTWEPTRCCGRFVRFRWGRCLSSAGPFHVFAKKKYMSRKRGSGWAFESHEGDRVGISIFGFIISFALSLSIYILYYILIPTFPSKTFVPILMKKKLKPPLPRIHMHSSRNASHTRIQHQNNVK